MAWLIIFAQLSILGTSFVFLASAGNSIYAKQNLISLALLLVGIATLVVCCILSYIYEVETFFASTVRNDDDLSDKAISILPLILGSVLICFQIKSLIQILLPESWYKKDSSLVRGLLVSGMARKERRTKRAARWKINSMVQNALELHDKALSLSIRKSSSFGGAAYGNAMLAYDAAKHDKERLGGIVWTFKKMWSGAISQEEGVWLHARLIASNCSQYFTALFYLLVFVVIYQAVYDPDARRRLEDESLQDYLTPEQWM